MTSDPDGAIEILREGLNPKRPGHFIQADALVDPYFFYLFACTNNCLLKSVSL